MLLATLCSSHFKLMLTDLPMSWPFQIIVRLFQPLG
jgi:hypothetical protein